MKNFGASKWKRQYIWKIMNAIVFQNIDIIFEEQFPRKVFVITIDVNSDSEKKLEVCHAHNNCNTKTV